VALDGLDVPGERDEVAPQAIVGEQPCSRVDIAGAEGGVERVEPGLDGAAGVRAGLSRGVGLVVR